MAEQDLSGGAIPCSLVFLALGASAVTVQPFRAAAMPTKCMTAPALPLEPCRLSTLGSLQPPRLA
jgi:hypothetical protein